MISTLFKKSEKSDGRPVARKRVSSYTSPNHPYFLPFVTFANTGIALFTILLIFSLFGSISSLKSASKSRMAETSDGRTLQLVAIDDTDPSDPQLRGFVNRVMFSLHNWQGILPAEDELDIGKTIRDEGIVVGKNKNQRIPYIAWRTGFALEDGFRQEYLRKLAGIVPKGLFADPPTAFAVPEVREVGIPQKVGDKEWIVTWHGLLGKFEKSNLQKTIPLKYEVHVKKITRFRLCPRLTAEECKANMTETQKAIYNEQRENLIVTKFKELK